MGVLVRELAALYTALLARASRRRCPAADAVRRLRRRGSGEWLQGEVLEQQLAYWREQLAGAPRGWSCRPTGRGRRCRAFAAAGCASRLPVPR